MFQHFRQWKINFILRASTPRAFLIRKTTRDLEMRLVIMASQMYRKMKITLKKLTCHSQKFSWELMLIRQQKMYSTSLKRGMNYKSKWELLRSLMKICKGDWLRSMKRNKVSSCLNGNQEAFNNVSWYKE